MMSVFTIKTFIIGFLLIPFHSAELIYFAELPETVTAQTGSCLQIPCTFKLSDFTQKLDKTKQIHGIWDKDEILASVYNSSMNITRGSSKIQMIGNLWERNCTTVFYNITKNQTGDYYFRLEMEPNVFKATFNADRNNPNSSVFKPVRINVTDSPARPRLQLIGGEQTVMEGSTVTLKCSAEALCPQQTTISWSNFPESANIKPQRGQIKPDQTQSVFTEMTFTASDVDHKISCTVTYPRQTSTDTVEETMMLRVSFPPKETRVFIKPSKSVSVGSEVTLICRSKMSPTTNSTFIWFKSDRDKPLEHGENFRFNVTQNDAGLYHCVATNKHGNESSAQILLTVTGTILLPVIFGCTGGVLAFILFSGAYVICTRKRTQIQTEQDQQQIYVNVTNVLQSDKYNNSSKLQCEKGKAEREEEASKYSKVQMPGSKITYSHNMEDIYVNV